jgi:hypothetical protein
METFLSAHEIARQRGDGLKPELMRLLERTRTMAEARPCAHVPRGDLAAYSPGLQPSSGLERGHRVQMVPSA